MKNNYTKIKLCVVLLCFLVTRLGAQMAGVVTIDNTLPPSATNFISWTAFTASLNTGGVSGPLTVNVQTGTSYTEQVIFNAYTGASPVNSVTINGNGTTIQFNATSTANGHTIRLNGTDYLTINNLMVLGLGSVAWPLTLTGGSDNNSFVNCTFSVQIAQTSTNFIPVMCSGNPGSPTTQGDWGDNNTWTSCTMDGGCHGVSFYGMNGTPTSTNNMVVNCMIKDFYQNGVYNVYTQATTVRKCIFERLLRTNSTTAGGVYLTTGSTKCIVEQNWARRFYDNMLLGTSTTYGFFCNFAAGAGSENVFRNNIVSDMRFQGPLHGIYVNTSNNHIYNNTISLEDAGTTANVACVGIFATAATNTIVNNIINIARGGNGTKYGLQFGTTTATVNLRSDYNVINITSTLGVNAVGFSGTAFNTMIAWKGALGGYFDQASIAVDPQFTSLGTNYTPLNVLVNNMGMPTNGLGYMAGSIPDDINSQARSLSTPDPGAIEIFNVPCAGPPAVLTVSTPTNNFCAGTSTWAALPVSSYSNSGYVYQWQSSTSTPLGPWTAIPGATLGSLFTPSLANVTTWYSVVVVCPNQGTTTSVSGQVAMVPTVTSSVTYMEGFEALEPQRRLPNCSWLVTNSLVAMTQTVSNTGGRVPRTDKNFGMFQNTTPGVNSFYTNAIWMDFGITYSASVWLRNDGNNVNWTDVSILAGPNQNSTGQFTIASTNGPAVFPVYTALANTFTVPTSGFYYLAIRATSGAGAGVYMSFDDIKVEIPCSLNSPSLTMNLLTSTVCVGKPVTMMAMGADTYTWSTGDNAAAITVTPQGGTNLGSYTVSGTRAISKCTAMLTQTFNVYPAPNVNAVAIPAKVCSGSAVNLLAAGDAGNTYNWNNGVNTAANLVYPTGGGSTVTYSVFGTNSYGCDKMVTVSVEVLNLPNISVTPSANQICEGEWITFTGNGGQTYNWTSNSSIVYMGNPINVQLNSSAAFTVTGTDANGCSNKAFYTLLVDPCTGLKNAGKDAAGIKVYPNPAHGVVTVETQTKANIELVDLTGRVILSGTIQDGKTQLNMNEFAQGVYYLKVKSGSSVEVIKVVKN